MYYYLYVLFKTMDFFADFSYSLRFEMYLNPVNKIWLFDSNFYQLVCMLICITMRMIIH